MITNEVAFIAIAVSDKERARKFYQETLELKPSSTQMDGAWVEYDLGPITIGVGCHPAWKPSRDGTTVAFEVDDMDDAIAKLKERGVTFDIEKLRLQFAGWHNFEIQTGTNWWFTNERRNENQEMLGKQESRSLLSLLLFLHSCVPDLYVCSVSIKARGWSCRELRAARAHFTRGSAWTTARMWSRALRRGRAAKCSMTRYPYSTLFGKRDRKLVATHRWFSSLLLRLRIRFWKRLMPESNS